MASDDLNPGKLPPEAIDPATGRPWGVRAMRGGPILSQPVEEQKPEGYASELFQTPPGSTGPYTARLSAAPAGQIGRAHV